MPTLLLLDDSVIIQRMVAMTFAAENIAVTMATDGDEAIARIEQERPDVVVAATAAAKRSGYDVAAYVKSTPGLATTPVLLLAGAFEPVDQKRVGEVRADGVLVKPFEPQQLVARVREMLDRRPAAAVASERRGGQDPESYFEQLDAAFAKRSGNAPPARRDDEGAVPTLDAILENAPAAAAAAPPPTVTEDLVDELARRVAERLGTPAVRQVVADVVADVAERLIREEIARIRNKS